MEIILNDNATVAQARRLFRNKKRSRCRITVRFGRLYTIAYAPAVQPRTMSQCRNWNLFARANARVARDMKNASMASRWRKRARKYGYKTARGAARAYYIAMFQKQKDRRQRVGAERIEKYAVKFRHIGKPLRFSSRTVSKSSSSRYVANAGPSLPPCVKAKPNASARQAVSGACVGWRSLCCPQVA